ncbi:Polyketide synthase-nonribosomal peptide synthetase [Venustampulla echinocandica]|uniref:Polyketide synthase-nonribosomal peptide synthetase n=1 Tax=Venustampulla echinocandica TaxID=2656787 RepID=A0A370TE04_9HELO|nr:Polyketide synthase-nonribosomal peptide synthetase [Venustampulla echinocandica]RDL32698.1 Polyketide synthase-nonribosomal peptide synthetase [Venustampulla echinocandica]
MTKRSYVEEPIAIVGSACRFPGGSNSPSKLWDLLEQPRDVLKTFDPERLNLERFYHPDGETHGSTNVTNKSYLLEQDTRLFDASFFGITGMEAAGMDPQQRMLLETVYEAFESAGMTLEQLKGSFTSVHVGVMTNDWTSIQLRDPETIPQYTATGTANSIISNRISYVFDLQGPSVTIDTACSSSLVALHQAARGLLDGDGEAAVVAGVNIILDPTLYITESKLHMLSSDSRSRMWDKSASGYARGEGTSALLLKTLSRALRDGDHIEGLIRSTGVNSDGQSPGITMPFAPTQAALIRRTYRRAGLDPIKDRPQYFEAHGTGTPAGDPVEARAISDAFVAAHGPTSFDNPMYVGSIKTVIGHLEGCAGLAGVMKVLLALKHRTIPPNLLFNELNPAIAQYYGPLQIPTTALPWPELPTGTPARASVNSFGFGGTNAHAIIESYDNGVSVREHDEQIGVLGPLLFSAASGPSLLRTVRSYLTHLGEHPELDMGDLSWLLQTRRSTHRVRASFSGKSRESILENMRAWVATYEKSTGGSIGYQPRLVNPKEISGVLGVFTGQGAQWPTMGRELFNRSPLFRRTIEECESVLRALPGHDAPTWSLVQELLVEASSSRLSEAVIAQPMCTAIQLALVDLLAAAGIGFDAVIGHSSGEIAAVYASGIITRAGALQIAYYRGFHAQRAAGEQGQRGAMMAVGLSLDQASQFCSRLEFVGRLRVAASNSLQSVTLSGDIDAVQEAKQIFDADSVFARLLKVDTAYHSHHMQPCAQPYLQSLLACKIEVRTPKPGQCIWSSSVRGNTELLGGDLSSLKGPYWVANMVQTVLFSQAVESSIWHGGPFDVAIEVGPHPTLKGPVEQTLKAVYGSTPLYTGVLKRDGSDAVAFSTAIGAVWTQLGPSAIDFAGYRAAFYHGQPPVPRVPQDLPAYVWDHEKIHWRESTMSRRYRTGRDASNELLGKRTPDDNERELRWRNVLRLGELPWMRGHEVLGEVLLPGAAYVSFAVEAGYQLAAAAEREVVLLEVENVDILRPVVVPDNKDGVETLFTVQLLNGSSLRGTIDNVRAKFSYYVCVNQTAGTMVHASSGELVVHFGKPSESGDMLPLRDPVPANLIDIDCARVYSMFEGIGLKYTGPFHTMTKSSRCLGYATANGIWPDRSLGSGSIMHPALLDVAFQTLILARAHPASGHITTAILPSHIDRVRVSPLMPILQKQRSGDGEMSADFESWAVKQTVTSLTGDINVYDAASGRTLVQVEGLALNMVGEQDASRDRPVFAKTLWARDVVLELPDLERNAAHDTELLRLSEDMERVALFYARRLIEETASEDRGKFKWYHQRMLEAFDEHLALAASGQHPLLRREWLVDGPEILKGMDAAHPDAVQLQMLHAVGNNLAGIVQGQISQLQVMTKDDLLNRFFMEDLACIRVNQFLADTLRQITFKYPRCNILEIGAGTGGTTRSALKAIDDAYMSYTFTDISSAFLPSAEEKFAGYSHKMIFKTLDIENDLDSQGYAPHSFDIVIAANVLHATHNLHKTMRNVRSLLRPGGYVLLFETTGETLSIPLMFSGLPSWWPGEEPERRLRPIMPPLHWEQILSDTGFSGLDMVVHDVAVESKHTTALLVTQATNDTVLRLREPLADLAAVPAPLEPILLIGGKKLATAKMLTEIQKLLPRAWRSRVRVVSSVDDIDLAKINPGTDIICLHDIDEPLFVTTMTAPRLAALQSLLMKSRNLLWVSSATTGKTHSPRATMFHGIARVAAAEMAHLHVQILGLEAGIVPAAAARFCLEAFLRLRETAEAAVGDAASEGALLWAHEEEMEVLAHGEVIIPRVVADKALNEVYLASSRTVTKRVDATDLVTHAIPGPARMMLQAGDDVERSANTSRVQVKYALHIPAKTGDGIYLVCGTSASTSSPVIAISHKNSSVIMVPSGHLVTIAPEECTPDILVATADRLFVHAVTALAVPGSPVLFYGAETIQAKELTAELAIQGSGAIFASSDPDAPDTYIKIHAQSSKRAIQRAVPPDVTLYIDCQMFPSAVSDTLGDSFILGGKAWNLDARLLEDAFRTSKLAAATLLEDAYLYAKKTTADLVTTLPAHSSLSCDVVEVAALAGAQVSSLAHTRYVTDWQRRESLLLMVPPLDTRGLLRPDRTYLMTGAAGGLGLSICKWLLANGAKHMVITSRNPNVDPATLEDARRAGASVHVLAMDVSNKASVSSVVQHIRNTMPPIAGVCNAAMVLTDKLVLDMDINQLNGTLAPKVDGSELLDAAFGNEALDFFIMLSSSATVLGNIGQANYHVANLFMASLAAQRRSRGLPGSVVHVGHITDVGYIVMARDRTAQLEEHFRTIRLMPLSETDVHHAFAQAIRGGKPGSHVSPDIIMGVEPAEEPMASDVVEVSESKIPWLANPRLGHLVPVATLHGSRQAQAQLGVAGAGSLRQLVQDTEDEEEAVAVVLEVFCAKLEATLQLPAGRAMENAQRAIIDLGIDSLVAVEIRTWFLKELGVEVPVVKILGGDSVQQICITAARTVMSRNIKAERAEEIKAKAKASTAVDNSIAASAASSSPLTVPVPNAQNGSQVEEITPSVSETDDDSARSIYTSPDTDSSETTSTSLVKPTDSSSSSITEAKSETEQEANATEVEIIRQERMSRSQARIWFLSQHLDDPAAYNMRVGDGHAMQGLISSSAYELDYVPDADDNDLRQSLARLKTRTWDLQAGRTLGVAVLSRGPELHDFVFGYHHIITDVVGWFMFLQDLNHAYRMQPLDKASIGSHLDYTAQQLKLEEAGGLYDELLAFWQTEFSTLPDPLPLLPSASVRARPTQQAPGRTGKKIHSDYRTMAVERVAAVKATCRRLRISPFHFYLAVLEVLLARQTGTEDICVGIVDANRGDDEKVARMVGCFVNMLPVRVRVETQNSFAEVARGASRKALAAFAHAGLPFDVLLDAVKAPRWADGTTPPLFQAALNYRGAGWSDLPLGADCRMKLSMDDGKDAETPYDISLGVIDMAQECIIDLHCPATLYSTDAVKGMMDAYMRLVDAFASDPDMRIDKCSLHGEAQVSKALDLGKGPVVDFGWPATLSQRFLDMFSLHSTQPAVIDNGTTVSYTQIAARVNSVSNALRTSGCTAGDRIAVLCEPSADSIVALLAILQTGCVYVPLDTSLPTARHAAMFQSCEPILLLFHAATEKSVAELSNETSNLFREMRIDNISPTNPLSRMSCSSDPTAPAVLLFTSGSTGTPKGILLSQGNFANHIALKKQELVLGQEHVLQQSSLGFDMSLIQTFCALANGGCLVIAPRDVRRDPVAMTALVRKHRVSLTIATPSEYLTWLRYGSLSLQGHTAWRHACMGGELVSEELKNGFRRLNLAGLQLTNCYGPTEITAAASFQTIDMNSAVVSDYEIDDEEQHLRVKYAVGKALPNYSVCILDEAGRPQPVQTTGEICIGGAGVALGYLGLPDETRSKFTTDPSTGYRVYRTGDQGRLLADGTLLCFGRLEGDTQIKLRGLRVELQEVEVALLQAADGVLSTVVVSPRGDVLIAHATISSGHESAVGTAELAEILKRLRLPQYFIPASIIVLPTLPTNANGKLDRKAIAALPLPITRDADGTPLDPRPQEKMNVREGELRLLWERVLPAVATAERITPSSDFFLSGGNSMLLMRLQAAITESMGVKVPTRVLYGASTLAAMSRAVQERREAEADDVDDPEDIDWATETAVPGWLKQQIRETLQPSSTKTKKTKSKAGGLEIVLTGATGFLGGRLLHMLLDSPAVRAVHCIAVLPDDTHLLPQNSQNKIHCYTGSLADPTLGLTPTESELLEQTADVIVHAGASGHCLNNYATLRGPNLVSTHRLASLALPRAVPLLFISSNRVALLGGRTAQPAESLAAFTPPVDGREGYTASKWAGEVFLENLSNYYHQHHSKGNLADGKQQQNQTNWNVSVHRPCIVVGEQAPNSDSMNAILRFSLSMRSVPRLRRGTGFIDFAPVDGVAEEIVEAALQIGSGAVERDNLVVAKAEDVALQFRHHSSNVKVPLDKFRDYLEKVYGGRFEALEMREWVVKASGEGIDPLITAYLDGVLDTDEEMIFPYLGKD